MNPCDTLHAVPLDNVHAPANKCCPMCGTPESEPDTNRKHDSDRIEAVFRFAERVMWTDKTNKAIGTIMRIVAAKLINPGASDRQVAAASGVSAIHVTRTRRYLSEDFPEVVTALWPGRGPE